MYDAGMSETYTYRNTLTGLVERLTEQQASVYPTTLVRVADDAKPYVQGMFKPGLVGEHDNPEPPTDAEIQAEAELEAVLETSAPNSKAARAAKAELQETQEAAEKAAAEAQAAAEAARNQE